MPLRGSSYCLRYADNVSRISPPAADEAEAAAGGEERVAGDDADNYSRTAAMTTSSSPSSCSSYSCISRGDTSFAGDLDSELMLFIE